MIKVDFWQGRYETAQMTWDLGAASPHFEALLKEAPAFLTPGRMAVPGSGQGHDAALFGRAGFEVTGFDYAPGAVDRATKLYGDCARFVQADVFDLARPDSEWAGQFDYVLEHTCFCAILPKDRPAYVRSVTNLLRPGGYLIGIFWEHDEPDGPPFSTTEADLREAFGAGFEFQSLEARPPVADREGIERLVILRRKSSC